MSVEQRLHGHPDVSRTERRPYLSPLGLGEGSLRMPVVLLASQRRTHVHQWLRGSMVRGDLLQHQVAIPNGRRWSTLISVLSFGLLLAMSGCDGCAGGRAHRTLTSIRLWNTPRCWYNQQCESMIKCPPEDTPACTPVGSIDGDENRACYCSPFRSWENPDGGAPLLGACVRNPHGGSPVCGEWDGHRGVILGPDGGIIVDSHGGVL
jgi:hypothetical protein